MSRLESDYYAFMGYDTATGPGPRWRTTRSSSRPGRCSSWPAGGASSSTLLRRGRRPGAAASTSTRAWSRRPPRPGTTCVLGDAIEHLEQVEPGSLGGVFCAHFLEHLEPADVARVYVAAARALRPGGAFVAVVPSAGSLSVLGHDFWRDPTHVRFYDPMLLAFFAGQAGLTITEAGGNPLNDPGPPPPLVPQRFDPAPALTESLANLTHAVNAVYPAHVNHLRRLRREQATGRREATAVVDRPAGRAVVAPGAPRLGAGRAGPGHAAPVRRAAPGVPGAARPALPAQRGLRGRGRPARTGPAHDLPAGHRRGRQLQRRPPAAAVPRRAAPAGHPARVLRHRGGRQRLGRRLPRSCSPATSPRCG